VAGAKGGRGVVYSFFKTGDTGWSEGVALSAEGNVVGTLFGASISVFDTSILVGEPGRKASRGVARLYSNVSVFIGGVDEGQQSNKEGAAWARPEVVILLVIGLALSCCLGIYLVWQRADRQTKPKYLFEDAIDVAQPSGLQGPIGSSSTSLPTHAAERRAENNGLGGDECMRVLAVTDVQRRIVGQAEDVQRPVDLLREASDVCFVERLAGQAEDVQRPVDLLREASDVCFVERLAGQAEDVQRPVDLPREASDACFVEEVMPAAEPCADGPRECSGSPLCAEVLHSADAATSSPACVFADSRPSSRTVSSVRSRIDFLPLLHRHAAISDEPGSDRSESGGGSKVHPSVSSCVMDLDHILERIGDDEGLPTTCFCFPML